MTSEKLIPLTQTRITYSALYSQPTMNPTELPKVSAA